MQTKNSILNNEGQLTIPKEYRDVLGWSRETVVTLLLEEDGAKIVPGRKFAEDVLSRMQRTRWKGPDADEIMAETRSEIQ